jgi:hypothetical protein
MLVALTLLSAVVGLLVSSLNLRNSNTSRIASKVLSDMNAIEIGFTNFVQDKNAYPTSLADAAFVPSYLFPPAPPADFGPYTLASTGSSYYVCGAVTVTGAGDNAYLAIRDHVNGKAPQSKFYYNTTPCPHTTSMVADPSGAATINFTYYLIR